MKGCDCVQCVGPALTRARTLNANARIVCTPGNVIAGAAKNLGFYEFL